MAGLKVGHRQNIALTFMKSQMPRQIQAHCAAGGGGKRDGEKGRVLRKETNITFYNTGAH
jgi:hypothetical protein